MKALWALWTVLALATFSARALQPHPWNRHWRHECERWPCLAIFRLWARAFSEIFADTLRAGRECAARALFTSLARFLSLSLSLAEDGAAVPRTITAASATASSLNSIRALGMDILLRERGERWRLITSPAGLVKYGFRLPSL